MPTIEVTIPEDVYLALRKSPISQGKAAELAGLSRVEFLDELAKRKVPVIQMTVEELKVELAGG